MPKVYKFYVHDCVSHVHDYVPHRWPDITLMCYYKGPRKSCPQCGKYIPLCPLFWYKDRGRGRWAHKCKYCWDRLPRPGIMAKGAVSQEYMTRHWDEIPY